jgi:transglutaminase-like putative cysteine protease
MNSFRPRKLTVSLLFLFVLAIATLGQNQKWQPVSPGELQMKAPLVEPDADAEAILWDVRVSDEENGSTLETVLNHYVKIKIFNDRGREAFSKIDIQYGKIEGLGPNIRIRDIAARTTKPDGSVVELKDTDIFERDIEKSHGVKLKAKSFAVPGIEPGAVIEYRWKEIRGAVSYYQRLYFAREIPVELVRYHIKPLQHPTLGMSGQPFNIKNTPFTKEKDGFYLTTASNVPSYQEEPSMPPEYEVRPWMLLYYTKDSKIEPEKFWKDYGKGEYEDHKPATKVSDDVRQAANEAVGTESDPDKKVERIFAYVRAKIKYVYDDAYNLTEEQLKKVKENKNPTDTLKRGQGDRHDINMLFLAMTSAAGFDSRVVKLPLRSDSYFRKWFTDDYFMRTENIGVKIGENWKFFDPSSRYTPYGMLQWSEEGEIALISDSKEPIWATTPLSPASKSMEKRTGTFKILDDGSIEGTVRMEFTGHLAAYHKEYNDDDTPQQREETLKNIVKFNILGSAEVSDISIENVTDPDKPFIYTFKLRVPGYASRTGKRIFLQPNIFERNAKPMFEKSSRRYGIYFDFPYSERDEITIELPDGFELESPDVPPVIKDPNGIGIDEIKMAVTADKKKLIYRRNFSFGNGGNILFDQPAYPALKGLFEAFYQANAHAITLKQSSTTASTK